MLRWVPADTEEVHGARAKHVGVADSQRGGPVFNLPEEDLRRNGGLDCVCLAHVSPSF